jgi:hypothetical protein
MIRPSLWGHGPRRMLSDPKPVLYREVRRNPSATALTADPLAQAGPVARNVIGLAGLIALGAAAFGASRAWLLPATWILLLLQYTPPFGTPPSQPTYKVMLTWLMQPAGTPAATVAAVILGVTGTLAYAIFGPRV